MEYTYNVYDDIYHLILAGKKNIEVRLLNEKSEKILEGDFIIFNNLDEKGKYIKTKIIKKTIYKIPMEEVTKDQRRAAKAVNFGILYGISSFGLSEDLGIDVREAKKFIDNL